MLTYPRRGYMKESTVQTTNTMWWPIDYEIIISYYNNLLVSIYKSFEKKCDFRLILVNV